jgi:hypothetical protein
MKLSKLSCSPTQLINHVVLALVCLGGCAQMSSVNQPTAPIKLSESKSVLSTGYKKQNSPKDAAVYFINLEDGSTVKSPFKIQFGLSAMGVAPAGVEKMGTGHHHLLIDVAEMDVNSPIPADSTHKHFGMGQTETTLELSPGAHTLQLVLADQNHIPHDPVVLSKRITVNVE